MKRKPGAIGPRRIDVAAPAPRNIPPIPPVETPKEKVERIKRAAQWPHRS
ncbi:MAG TPA: hypothetical protein VD907_00265 [Verrucomicrobiae bacterium]|nr:hypothetical protein [Verrucomicrobiae bacterium]